MVHPTELWKRDSSNSTATSSSVRSSWRGSRSSANDNESNVMAAGPGSMASAAAFARGRRSGALKSSVSHSSIRSVESAASSTDSVEAAKKSGRDIQQIERRPSPQPRSSFSTYVDRAREVTRTHRVDSNASKRSYTSTSSKTKRRSADTVMQSGRHGNEWLFGGWSLRETVKGMLK